MKKLVAALVSLCVVAAPAHAASLRFDAVPQQGVSAVKWLGSTKLVQQRTLGRVSVVPRGLERGKLAFDVEVHNYSDRSAFFGQESVDVSSADQSLAPATAWDAERDARRKATWTRIGVAVAMVALVGLAVAAGGAPTAGQSLYIPSAPRRAGPGRRLRDRSSRNHQRALAPPLQRPHPSGASQRRAARPRSQLDGALQRRGLSLQLHAQRSLSRAPHSPYRPLPASLRSISDRCGSAAS